jgi:hypothetical protein
VNLGLELLKPLIMLSIRRVLWHSCFRAGLKHSCLAETGNTTRQEGILEGVVQLGLVQLDLVIGSLESDRDARKWEAVRIGFS